MFESGEDVPQHRGARNGFLRPLDELETMSCFGEIWGRPGLEPRVRGLVGLVTLAALGRYEELGVHVRGALTNGATVTEIQEALLQVASYVGAEAAEVAFRRVEAVLGPLVPTRGRRAS